MISIFYSDLGVDGADTISIIDFDEFNKEYSLSVTDIIDHPVVET